MSFNAGLGQELTKELSSKVQAHRNEFHQFFIGRFLEGLSTLFFYNIEPPFEKTRLEIGLRRGYFMVFGKNKLGVNTILGYTQGRFGWTDTYNYLNRKRITGKDIIYTIPRELIPDSNLEIWAENRCKDGDCVVFYNKPLNLTNDFEIISHYADELAEIVASRFSLIMQAKFMTVIAGDVGDETINQMVSALYNGDPFVKIAKTFDIDDNIIKIDNGNLSTNLESLKTEYQNKIAELNALFGINVLAVNKASGVTTSEANGNLGFVTANANIWLTARQQTLDLFNRRYGTDYQVQFDQHASAMLMQDGGENNEQDNNNAGGDSTNGGTSQELG